jgi:uncharacterized protein
MVATVSPAEADGILEDIRIVDCDAHITEPPDLWVSRAPASLKDKVPQQRTVDGLSAWYLEDHLWSGIGGNTIRTGQQKVIGEHIVQPFADVDESAWDTAERLKLMDAMGVWAQIIYPNGVGFSSNHIFAIEDEAQRTAVLQLYNDFLVDTQEASNQRLFPQAMLPIWDMELTIKEMQRLLDKGITGFTLSDRPELLDLPELDQPYFAPMWTLANESGAVMNFHIGAGGVRARSAGGGLTAGDRTFEQAMRGHMVGRSELYWSSFGHQRALAILATQMYMSNARIIVNLCMGNLFDRYPQLKIVSAESGIGWIPFILEAMEYQLDEMVTLPEERALQQRRPTEYFRDHIYVTFWFETVGPAKLIEDVGVKNVLIETDVPHPTCLYPGAREHFAAAMAAVDPAIRKRVLEDNAVEAYNLPVR